MSDLTELPIPGVRVRRGETRDVRACHDLLWLSVTDFAGRNATPLEGSADDWWISGQSLHEYLAVQAAEWWVAEDEGTSEIVGYARSIARGGMLELTEFFVRPGRQSAGIGRLLIARAFPADGYEVRSIVATGDVRALGRYYRAGTTALFPILSLSAAPARGESLGRLSPIRLSSDSNLDAVIGIDRSVVGYPRDRAELSWLLSEREGWVYQRGSRTIAIAFVGKNGSGPVATLDPEDQPVVLEHVESRAAELGVAKLELEVPSVNGTAIRHLLARGYRLSAWVNYFMADRPFGQFDRYVCFSPPIFL